MCVNTVAPASTCGLWDRICGDKAGPRDWVGAFGFLQRGDGTEIFFLIDPSPTNDCRSMKELGRKMSTAWVRMIGSWSALISSSSHGVTQDCRTNSACRLGL